MMDKIQVIGVGCDASKVKQGIEDKLLQATYSKIKSHRNSQRLWIEGKRLAAAGFTPGTTFQMLKGWSSQDLSRLTSIELMVDSEGPRKVSSRKRKATGRVDPIIDICSKELWPAGTEIRVVFSQNRIRITIHHETQNKIDRESRVKDAVKGNTMLREASACTGIGVSTKAIHDALAEEGVLSVVDWVVDRDGRYLQVAVDNNDAFGAETTIFEASMEELEPELLSPVELLSITMDCSPFARSGVAKNGHGYEAHTSATGLFGAVQIVKASNPAVIVSENVVTAENSASYQLMIAELTRLGYRCRTVTLDGSDAGVLENRERWYLVAISEGLGDFDLDNLGTLDREYHFVGNILEREVPEELWSHNEGLNAKAGRDKSKGSNFKRQLITPFSSSYGTVGKGYNKKRSTEPFLVGDDGRERLLTPVEHARGKGIDPKLIHDQPKYLAHEGLGQSVLPGHFKLLVQRVIETLRSAAYV